jgi:hypothetical protein
VGDKGLIAIVGGVVMGNIVGDGDKLELHSTGMAQRWIEYFGL